MKKEFKKVVVASVAVLGFIFLMKIFGGLVAKLQLPWSPIKVSTLTELIAAGCSIMAVFIFKKTNIMKLKVSGFGEGLLAGMVYLIVNGVIYLSFIINHAPITVSRVDMIFYVCQMVLIGVSEEFLFRGVLQNVFHECLGENSRKSIMGAIVMSASVFGLLHLTNLLSGAGFIPVMVQAIAAIFAGIILGICYYRSGKNIWVCVFLHAFIDGAGLLSNLTGSQIVEAINQFSVAKLIPLALYGVVILIISRKVKPSMSLA